MKIFVTGGAGLVGPEVIRNILNKGHEVCCFDINPKAPVLDEFRDRIEIARGDVTSFDDVMRAMVEAKPDRIIHLAFQVDGGISARYPHDAVRLNIMGTDNVFEAARLCGIKRVVYASSLGVYGQQKYFGERPVTEEDEFHGVGVYQISKIYNEHQAKWFNSAFNMEIVGIRAANIIGARKIVGSVDMVQVITLPACGKPARYPYKDFMRLLITVPDISEIFVQTTLADSLNHTIYNSGGIGASLGEIAEIVKKYIPDADITFEKEEGGKAISGNYLMDNSRLINEFPGITLTPLSQIIKTVINDTRKLYDLPELS